MRHLRRIGYLIALGAIGFLVFQWNVTHFHLGYWLQVHTGTVNEPGPYYGFFSGFGSDLGEYAIVTSILGGIYHTAKKSNCHTHRCLRIGAYPAGDYKVCKKHHGEIHETQPTIDHIKDHVAAAGGTVLNSLDDLRFEVIALRKHLHEGR